MNILFFRPKLNKNPEVFLGKILNITLSKKKKALKQTKENEKNEEEKNYSEIQQFVTVDPLTIYIYIHNPQTYNDN